MSKNLRTFIIIVVLSALAGAGYAYPLTQTLTFERSDFNFAAEQGYTRVSSPGMAVTAEPGKPELPEKSAYIILPPGTRATGLRVLEAREEAIPEIGQGYAILPRCGRGIPLLTWRPRGDLHRCQSFTGDRGTFRGFSSRCLGGLGACPGRGAGDQPALGLVTK